MGLVEMTELSVGMLALVAWLKKAEAAHPEYQ